MFIRSTVLELQKFQKFIGRNDKICLTASDASSIKENEERNKKDGSVSPNSVEQLPSTLILRGNSAELKSFPYLSSGKSDDVLRGNDRNGPFGNEHLREKKKSAISRSKGCKELYGQPNGCKMEHRDLKKKQMNDAVTNVTDNKIQIDNMRIKVAKNFKCKDGEAPLAKKSKKDLIAGNKCADGVQVISFI